MTISHNSFVGSFVLSFFTPWRTNEKSEQEFVSVNRPDHSSKEDHVSTIVNLKSPHTTRPLDNKSPRFKRGHRRSAVTNPATTPEVQNSLNQFTNAFYSQMQNHGLVIQKKDRPKDSRQQQPLSPIEEEAESPGTNNHAPTLNCGHNLTPLGITGGAPNHSPLASRRSSESLPSIPEEDEELEYVFPSLTESRQAEDDAKPSHVSLRSEVLCLQAQLNGARKEIEDLNAELADAVVSDEVILEAEERMEELLIEKTGWIKTQRALTQNIALLTDELQSEKVSRESLQRENDLLRDITSLYKASVQAICPQRTLIHQDAIDLRTAMLSTPLSGLVPIRGTAECTTPLTHPTTIATPPRSPCFRSSRSLRFSRSTPLIGFRTGVETTNEGSYAKRSHKPLEGSPLRLVTTLLYEEERSVGDCTRPVQKMTTLNDCMFSQHFSPILGNEEEDEFYDCEDAPESPIAGSPSGRTSRLGMISYNTFFL